MGSRARFGHAALLVAALSGGVGCAEDECNIDEYTRDLGGIGVMDCGLAGDDTSAVDECALTAYRGRKTFRALYENEDGDLEAIVHAAGGTYHLVREAGSMLEQADCKGGQEEVTDDRRRVGCDGQGAFETVCE